MRCLTGERFLLPSGQKLASAILVSRKCLRRNTRYVPLSTAGKSVEQRRGDGGSARRQRQQRSGRRQQQHRPLKGQQRKNISLRLVPVFFSTSQFGGDSQVRAEERRRAHNNGPLRKTTATRFITTHPSSSRSVLHIRVKAAALFLSHPTGLQAVLASLSATSKFLSQG